MLARIQHRGFTSCGYVTDYGNVQYADRVHELIRMYDPGIGHVRYATQKSPRQPFAYDGSWLAFNGEVDKGDTARLAEALSDGGYVDGAYSFLWMKDEVIYAGRDPNGFHPLYYAYGEDGYIAASEPVADPSLRWLEVPPGGLINLKTGAFYQFADPKPTPCCFEDVYFSHIASEGVWNRRSYLGALVDVPPGVDAIVPVPESSIAAAESLARTTKVPVVSAIVKNRYAERTFIAEEGFDAKYTLIADAIKGKRIVLLDDSIVRGNTMAALVPRLKQYAREVHVRVTFPQIKYACRYGVRIDGPGCGEVEGADSLEFLDPKYFSGCRACVDGVYSSVPTVLPTFSRFPV